jgi:hypothetical protein
MFGMTRRDFVALLGGVVPTWSLAARAQQAVPVIGFLGSQSPGPIARSLSSLQEGLKETGYIVGQNVTIEFLWADDQYDRLPAMAADLVRRPVDFDNPDCVPDRHGPGEGRPGRQYQPAGRQRDRDCRIDNRA